MQVTMNRKTKLFAYVALVTGLLLSVLLLLALDRDPLTKGFRRPEREATLQSICPWCEEDQPLTFTDVIGMVLIAVVVLSLPAGHIALLVMLAAQASRPPDFADLKPALHCPHCAHPLVKPWRVCPYCGQEITRPDAS